MIFWVGNSDDDSLEGQQARKVPPFWTILPHTPFNSTETGQKQRPGLNKHHYYYPACMPGVSRESPGSRNSRIIHPKTNQNHSN
jgi:hypothetical protein